MNINKNVDIQKLIQEMQDDIQQLETEIEKRKPEKKFTILQRFPFFSPFLKSALLTLIVLIIMFICNLIIT